MIGETVGNFEIISQLGKGGMGAVYLAQQRITKTKVAIKVLQSDVSNQQHVERFFGEAIAVSQIHHSGIVKIFDVGHLEHHDGAAYLVMEYLQGETLTSRIKQRGKLTVADVSDFGRQIASVLEATHGAAITHRDLKPDNIYLVRDSELPRGERVKVLDFGIAKLVRPKGPRMTSLDAGSIGTPNYMSPEQWHSLAEVDWRTDAYALGCVLFEMLCGRPPFVGESMTDICAKHLDEMPVPPSSLVPGLPPQLDHLVLRLLEKEPAGRPTMRDVMMVLAEIGHGEGIHLTTLPPGTRSPLAGLQRPTPQPHESLAQQLAYQQTVPSPSLAHQPTVAQAPSTQPAAPRKSRRIGLVIALVALAIAGTVGAAVVIGSTSKQPTETTAASGAVTPDAAQVAVALPDAAKRAAAPLDAATIAVAPADAAAIAEQAVDAGAAAVIATVPPDAGVVTIAPPDAGVLPTAPPLPKVVTLATLPKFQGELPVVTAPTKLDVCFSAAGRVMTVQSTPPLPPKEKLQVMGWRFAPQKATKTCGPLAVKPKEKPPVVADTRDPPRPPPDPDVVPSVDIGNVVQRQTMALRACGRDHVAGWVVFQVEVAPDGSTKLATVNPGANIKAFRACVEKEIAKLRFDAKPKGGKATVRLMFHEPPPPPSGGGY